MLIALRRTACRAARIGRGHTGLGEGKGPQGGSSDESPKPPPPPPPGRVAPITGASKQAPTQGELL